MQGDEVDYLSYPIIIVNPDRRALSWLSELEKDFLFYVVSGVEDYVRVMADQKAVAAIVLDQIEQSGEFLAIIKGQQIKTFVLVSADEVNYFKNLTSLSYHPLFKPCQPEILRLEFVRAIERQVWKRERDLLLTVHRQESWFSLIGQLSREWAHEVRNHAAIISLNAEIGMSKARKQRADSLNAATTMEKIIEQCLKISETLDSLRELTNIGQTGAAVSLKQVIRQIKFLIKLESMQIQVEERGAAGLFLSRGESAWLQSALVNILKYYGRIKNRQAMVSILIEERQGLYLKIWDAFGEPIPFDCGYLDGSLQSLVSVEPKLLNFAIGIRLLRSFGGEVSIGDTDYGPKTALVINLPVKDHHTTNEKS